MRVGPSLQLSGMKLVHTMIIIYRKRGHSIRDEIELPRLIDVGSMHHFAFSFHRSEVRVRWNGKSVYVKDDSSYDFYCNNDCPLFIQIQSVD